MIRYQGESIDFSIALKSTSAIAQWTDFDSLAFYLYTDTAHIAKFAATITEASDERTFTSDTLTLSADGKTINGTLSSSDTLTMTGALYFDVLGRKGTSRVYIRSQHTDIRIDYAPIKAEL